MGVHKWILPEGPGLYYMTGVNNENPRLGRNGIGKSTLLDAISWCLFGRTTRGLRATDVVSRGCSSSYVYVTLIIGNSEFEIKTIQNPNSLTVNGHITDREALTKQLRLNFQSFLYSIIIPQAGNSFLDLSPGEKLTLFSQIMDLDLWLEKSELALEKSKEIKSNIDHCERDIAQHNGRLTAIVSTMNGLQVKSEEFDQKKAEKVEHLSIELNKIIADIEGFKTEIVAFDLAIKELGPKIRCAEDAVKGQDRHIKDLEFELTEADKELSVANHKITVIKDSLKQLESVGAICSVCKQSVDEQHLIKETKKFENDLKTLQGLKAVLIDAKKEININKSEIITFISKLDIEFMQLKMKETKTKGNKNAIENEIIYLEREYKRLEIEIKKIKEQKNEFDQMIAEKRDEVSGVNKKIEGIKSKIAQLNEDYAATHFWVAGFKRLRLHIIEETLRTLEVEVNNNLASLGLGDWKIEFDIERENKSGSVTRGFSTFIHGPNDEIIKYESLSGGEGQRARLAGCFGLSNLIMERAGLSNKIEFYDEISQHMSGEGIEDVLNTLRDRAENSDRTIVTVDHHALDYGDFSGTIIIIKDKDGSRIEHEK